MISNTYNLFVCVPNHFIKRVKVHGSSQISILNVLFQKEKKLFICKGQILVNESTFESNSINSNDYIVALTKNDQPSFEYEIMKWLQSTKDPELFREKITKHKNSSISLEEARLRDLRARRLEQKKYFVIRRMGRRFEHSGISPYRDIPLSIEYDTYDEPNSKPLPVLWANTQCNFS